jgi:hypothetical protein
VATLAIYDALERNFGAATAGEGAAGMAASPGWITKFASWAKASSKPICWRSNRSRASSGVTALEREQEQSAAALDAWWRSAWRGAAQVVAFLAPSAGRPRHAIASGQ